jgi:hypothetical protein
MSFVFFNRNPSNPEICIWPSLTRHQVPSRDLRPLHEFQTASPTFIFGHPSRSGLDRGPRCPIAVRRLNVAKPAKSGPSLPKQVFTQGRDTPSQMLKINLSSDFVISIADRALQTAAYRFELVSFRHFMATLSKGATRFLLCSTFRCHQVFFQYASPLWSPSPLSGPCQSSSPSSS